ncbi:MAG: metallophosphoesterase family protein [Clostridia bacterium]|nr:metallophosphoesterase family protein [Clostridia bacterium]
MKILVLADEPVQRLWGEYGLDTLRQADLVLSCGDLPSSYLSYMTCFCPGPVVYVHGNHDDHYDKKPPEGCINAEGHVVMVNGIRILGLGGSMRYRPGCPTMFSEAEMSARIRKLRRELKGTGGFDLLLAHSPIAGVGDQPDLPHRGFECFKPLLSEYRPRVMFHGHVHQAYAAVNFVREREYEGIPVINACGSYLYDWPDEWKVSSLPGRLALRRMMKRSQPGEEYEHF